MGFDAQPELFTDFQEQSLGAFSQVDPCEYFSAGEIAMIWRIVCQRAEYMRYRRPLCGDDNAVASGFISEAEGVQTYVTYTTMRCPSCS